MSDRDSGEDLSRLVAELVTTLEDLESELDPPEDRPLRPPKPSELRLFASDVAIPGLILVLETNIRALRLLQRALRLSEGTERTRRESRELGRRARDVSETTLERLDDALVDLQDAVEGRPNDEEAADLLADARELRSEVQTRLREYADDAANRARKSADRGDSDDGAVDIAVEDVGDQSDGEGSDDSADASESSGLTDDGADEDDDDGGTDDDADVGVNVDAELESIKREIDGAGDEKNGTPEDVDAGDETGGSDGDETGGSDGDETDADDSNGDTDTGNPQSDDPTDDEN